jgi:uncharacterized membrane protein
MAKTMILMVMGRIGLGLLLVSGFYLISPYWKVLGEMPWLIAKLILVGVLLTMVIVISIVASRARRQGNPTIMAKLKPIGILNFLIGIIILIMAVMSFH